MHSLPVGSVLLIVVVDLAIVELLSVFIGVLVARAANKPVFVGLLLGVFVPIFGPLIWMGIEVTKDTSVAGLSRAQARGTGLYAAVGLLGVAALLFLVAIPIPWGSMDGSIQNYSLVGESSAADTGVGLFAMVGTSAVLVAGLVAVLLFTVRRRVAIVAAMLGAAWLIIAVDGLVLISAVDQLSRTVDGLSAGVAAAGAAPGVGLYVSLLAAIAAIAGASVLGLIASERVPDVAAAWTAPAYAAQTPAHLPFGTSQASPYAPPAAPTTPIRDEF